jgi:hypothetical protein
VTNFHDDEELLALLGQAFPTQPVRPDETARLQLREALTNDNLVSFAGAASRRARLRRRLGSHASALTISAIAVVALGGVAAAAVATNTLPGPTRNIAYDIGFPVTSPALAQARQQLHQLDVANAQHHTVVARQLGHGLLHDLTLLNHSDLSQIRTAAQKALTPTGLLQKASKILGIATSSTTTTVAPSSSTSTTTTTTLLPTLSTVIPTIPSKGPIVGITGSTPVGGILKKSTSTVTTLLPKL